MGVAAAAVGAGLSVGGGLYKTIKGAKMEREAQRAIDSYERQELTNQFDRLRVSTLGADLQREQLAQLTSSSLQALRSAGARGVIGGSGALQQTGVNVARQIGADLDRQQIAINQMQAQDDVRIQQMQENREYQDLAGLGAKMNVGMQAKFGGISDIIQGFASGANIAGAAVGGAPGGALGGGGEGTLGWSPTYKPTI